MSQGKTMQLLTIATKTSKARQHFQVIAQRFQARF